MHYNHLITNFPSNTSFFDYTELFDVKEKKQVFVVDENVFSLFNFSVLQSPYFIVKSGEKNKSFQSVDRILYFLVSLNIDTNYELIGMGGGVVCDLVSFVASIYKRGIKHSLVPTTLLAMVDASYGGKTAVNFSGIKNLCGTYKIPENILIDVSFLRTLTEEELLNGFAEILKISFTSNKDLFLDISKSKSVRELQFDQIIRKALITKKGIIENDLFDNNNRKILNFGHTYGHAIESEYKLKHGFAVAVGCLFELKLLHSLSLISSDTLDNYRQVFNIYFNKIQIGIKINEITKFILNDKKINNGFIELVKINSVGNSELICVDINNLLNYAL